MVCELTYSHGDNEILLWLFAHPKDTSAYLGGNPGNDCLRKEDERYDNQLDKAIPVKLTGELCEN